MSRTESERVGVSVASESPRMRGVRDVSISGRDTWHHGFPCPKQGIRRVVKNASAGLFVSMMSVGLSKNGDENLRNGTYLLYRVSFF